MCQTVLSAAGGLWHPSQSPGEWQAPLPAPPASMRLDLKVPEVSLSMWTLAGYLRRFRALLRKGAINFLSNFVPVAFPGVIGPRGEVINRKWKMGGGDLASENVVPPPALPLPPHPVLCGCQIPWEPRVFQGAKDAFAPPAPLPSPALYSFS